MKKTSIIIFCVGLLASLFFGTSIYQSVTGDALGGGYGVLFVGYPLIILGIILFIFSLFIYRQR
jgi:hypothetical protein